MIKRCLASILFEDDDGEVTRIRCQLAAGHPERHAGTAPDGDAVYWRRTNPA